MAVITDLIAKLKLDDSQFRAGLSSAQGHVQSFSNSAVTAFKAVASAFAIGYAIKEVVSGLKEATSNITAMVHSAERLGIGFEALEKLTYAAKLSGVSTEQLNTSLKFMEKNLGNLELGLAGGKLPQYFNEMNIQVGQLLQLPIEKQFLAITSAIDKMPDPLERAAARMAIFGRGGVVIGSMSGQVEKLSANFEKLGVGLSAEQGESVVSFGKSVLELGAVWEGFSNQLIAVLAGPLKDMIQGFESNIQEMGGMKAAAKAMGDIIIPILKGIATAANVAALAMTGYGDIVKLAALASAKLGEARAKSKLQDAKDFGTPAEIKAAASEYANATRYVQGMREAIKGTVDEQQVLISSIPSITALMGKDTKTDQTAKLKLQESAISKQIRLEKDRYQGQKDITSEMQRQIEASHTLYESVKEAHDFEKQVKKDLDSIASSIRQDAQENSMGIAHAGDRDKNLDQYMPNRDKVGHVRSDSADSERTAALKEEFNQKIDDRAEQIKHTNLLTNIHAVELKNAIENKTALAQLDKQLESIKAILAFIAGGGKGVAPTGPQAPASAGYNTTDKLAPWSMDIGRDGKTSHYGNEKQAQNVNVNISAADGFVASVANSSAMNNAITTTVKGVLGNASTAHA